MYIVFNPKYALRSDEKRVVIFDSTDGDGWMSYIHPIHAIVLATISYTNNVAETESWFYENMGISKQIITSFVHSLLDNQEITYVKFGDMNISFPPNTLISSTEVNKRKFDDIIHISLNMNDVDLKTKRLYTSPDKIVIMLNNKCAVKCNYCYADTYTTSSDLNFDDFCNLITECKTIGVRKIELIGGDVLVKPNWEEYISFLLNSGYPVDFLSTKKPLKESDVNKLINLQYRGDLQISLDTVDETIHKSLLYAPNDYLKQLQQTFDILSSFRELPFKVRISTVLCSNNASFDSIFQLFSFLNQYSIISRWDICYALLPFKKGNIELCTSRQESLVRQYIRKIQLSYNPFFEIVLNAKGVDSKSTELLCKNQDANYRCSANVSSCFILPDGKVTLCERLYWNKNFIIGDLKQDSLAKIWRSPRAIYLSELEKHIDEKSPCFSCIGKTDCYGKNKRCLVNVFLRYGNNITFPDPSCINSI